MVTNSLEGIGVNKITKKTDYMKELSSSYNRSFEYQNITVFLFANFVQYNAFLADSKFISSALAAANHVSRSKLRRQSG